MSGCGPVPDMYISPFIKKYVTVTRKAIEMAVYKDNATGTWRVVLSYTDLLWNGNRHRKEGFRRSEVQAWERE